MLDPADVVLNPVLLMTEVPLPTTLHRVCHSCYEEVTNNIPSRLHQTSTMGRIVVDQERLTIPGSLTRRESSSQLSDLAEYVDTILYISDNNLVPVAQSVIKILMKLGMPLLKSLM